MISSTASKLPSVERPWLKYFSDEVKKEVIAKETMYQRLVTANRDKLDRVAYDYLDMPATFAKLISDVEEAASAFAALGVKKGDIVACLSMSCPEVITAMYALNKLGAAILLLDPRRSPEEIKHFVGISKCKILMVTDIFYPNIERVIPNLNLQNVIVSKVGRSAGAAAKVVLAIRNKDIKISYGSYILSFDDFLKRGAGVKTSMVGYYEFDLAAITLSGGTTGTPKGIMITNRMVSTLVLDVHAMSSFKSKNTCTISIAPVFSSYGFICGTHMPLSYGHKTVVIPKPEADKFSKLFIKHKPGNITLVPGFYEKLVDNKRLKRTDMSFLVNAVSGGDSMSAGLEVKTNKFLKEHHAQLSSVSQGYGMSEMCSAVTVCTSTAYKFSSVGIPMLHVNLCICEPGTTKELGYYQPGEICTSGPSLMKGYLCNEEETNKAVLTHEDGTRWYHSGDMGFIDKDGFLFFTGRIKLSIPLPDGHKVFPIQLTDVVSKVPNVASCACVGVKDGKSEQGLWPVVAVVLKDKALKEQTLKDVKAALKCGVEERSQPIDIYEVDELPLIGMGKFDYKKIAEDYMTAHGISF